MDAKADEKWRWSTPQETGHVTDIVRSNTVGITAATPDYLNALQQQIVDAEASLREVMSDKFELALQLAEAEAKAARYEEALERILNEEESAGRWDSAERAALDFVDIARDAFNPPSPITPGEAQG